MAKTKLLIVDDEEAIREVVSTLLEALGYECASVSNGRLAKEFLIQLGIPADRLKTISYGKERPQCADSNEACWQKNRRAHFAAGQ